MYQYAPVDKQRRHTSLYDLESFRLERPLAQGGEQFGFAARDGEAPVRPHQGVHDHGQRAGAALAGQPGQPTGMIEMSVAQHDSYDRAEVDTESVSVDDHAPELKHLKRLTAYSDPGLAVERGTPVPAHQ